MGGVLPKSFYARDTELVARELLEAYFYPNRTTQARRTK